MKILLDTNVVVELLLDQPHARDVERLLERFPLTDIRLTIFTVDSIGVMFSRRKLPELFLDFVREWLIKGGASQITLSPEDMQRVVELVELFKLDFDDAYQYAAAEKYDLTLVSFDAHFDTTPRGRKTPADLFASA